MLSPSTRVALPPALAHDVGFLLARCSAAAVRATNTAIADLGLRARHYALLQLVVSSGGCSQRQLAADLGLDPSAVVALVDDLEQAGRVERTQDPSDRRTRLVLVTDRGREVLDTASELVDGALRAVTAPLSTTEIVTLEDLLRRVVAQVD